MPSFAIRTLIFLCNDVPVKFFHESSFESRQMFQSPPHMTIPVAPKSNQIILFNV